MSIHVFKLLSFLTFFFISSTLCFANSSAVILQYHHVSDDTPYSTSITPKQFKKHIQWLKDNNFKVLSLPELVSTLKNNKEFKQINNVAITFDDANRSVCEIAWPVLKKYKLPFTLFISTEAVENNFQSQCTWADLKEMHESGLMTPANHSHRHLNMVSSPLLHDSNWTSLMQNEVLKAQQLIEQRIGHTSMFFAYPFGEYNLALEQLISSLGFIGFGQQSGAVGHQSNFSALPRFPASGQFANLETLSTKLFSLAFPATFTASSENPIQFAEKHNPPYLTARFSDKNLLSSTNCFNSAGQALETKIQGDSLIAQASTKLDAGRHRYTCTSTSHIPKRFYWYSHQWLVEESTQQ